MTKQAAVTAGDHIAGVPQERLDPVTGRGLLPVVTVEPVDTKENLGNFLLGRAIAVSIHGLQHESLPSPLLTCEPQFARDGAAMKRAEKATHGLDSIEALEPKRNDGDSALRHSDRVVSDLKILTISEGQSEIRPPFVADGLWRQRMTALAIVAKSEARWGLGQHNNPCILLRKPEDRSVRRRRQGVDGEIAIPTAGFSRSVCRNRRGEWKRPQSPRHRHRCGAAIPRQDRMPSMYRDGRILPRSAMLMRQASSFPPKFIPDEFWEVYDPRLCRVYKVVQMATPDAGTASR